MSDETAARVAIQALVAEFAWRIDHGEAERVPELFTEDGRFAVPGSAVDGQEQLTEAFAARASQHHVTRHVCTNLRLEFQSTERARGTVLVTQYRHNDTGVGEVTPFAVNDYEDEYRCGADGRWRFAERCVVPIFRQPAEESQEAPDTRRRGKAARDRRSRLESDS